MEESNGLGPELESFRQQWLSEVRTKKGEQSTQPQPRNSVPSASTAPPPPRKSMARRPSPAKSRKAPPAAEEEDEYLHGRSFDDGPEPSGNTIDGSVRMPPERELVSALDHYEEAMEKEALGNMGDSLKLYRKAYRMDHGVHRRYREKHFPQHKQPQSAPTASSTQITSTDATPAGGDAPVLLPIKDLIASFAGLQIEAAPPETDGTPPAPCPLSCLPSELLVHIMQDVAALDVGDFARLSLVCKPLAYLVATEERTWRHVCLGARFGFAAMHRRWSKTVEWEALDEDDGPAGTTTDDAAATASLVPVPYASWRAMFRGRPRIRFNGCYISTVNYVRSGQASTNQATWGGAPIHIVTYYRYLRFFRDGTAISLLTTLEPTHVVHHLTGDLLRLHRDSDNAHAHLPSAAMQRAYKGRWRLSLGAGGDTDAEQAGPPRGEEDDEQLREGDVTVETEGVDPKYMFRMDLSLRTAGKAARNNKLVWRSFFSYNRLTDDWAEFTLKHDKAFFFSRVRSYGVGE
ncbi:F-box protein HRT3 [Metarhizium anisopliae]|nr:F-box protein HRT3 [Metarhizium anisopliae]